MGTKRVYHLLHNELARIDENILEIETIYVVDKQTGDMIPIAEGIPEDAEKFIQDIKKRNTKGLSFAMIYQETQMELCKKLSGNSFRILCMMLGNMKYDNSAYGLTHRKIAEFLGMSTRTVNRSMKELDRSGSVVSTGRKGSIVYHINPAYAWKGSFHRIKYKLPMFDKAMEEDLPFTFGREDNEE